MKNYQKGSTSSILIIVIVLLIIGFGWYMYQNKQNSLVNTDSQNTVTPQATAQNNSNVITENYVSVLDSSVHQARLKFSVPVISSDLNSANVKVCIISGSAGNSGIETCNPSSKIKLSYDSAQNLLTISENNIDSHDLNKIGIFRTGCASCTHQVLLENIHISGGSVLPKKSVFIY